MDKPIASNYFSLIGLDQRRYYVTHIHWIVLWTVFILLLLVLASANRHVVVFLHLRTVNQRTVLPPLSILLRLPLPLLQKRRVPFSLYSKEVVKSSGLVVPVVLDKYLHLARLYSILFNLLNEPLIYLDGILANDDPFSFIFPVDLSVPFTLCNLGDLESRLRIGVENPFKHLFAFNWENLWGLELPSHDLFV